MQPSADSQQQEQQRIEFINSGKINDVVKWHIKDRFDLYGRPHMTIEQIKVFNQNWIAHKDVTVCMAEAPDDCIVDMKFCKQPGPGMDRTDQQKYKDTTSNTSKKTATPSKTTFSIMIGQLNLQTLSV